MKLPLWVETGIEFDLILLKKYVGSVLSKKKYMNTLIENTLEWIMSNYQWIISVAISIFMANHVSTISKRLKFINRIDHRKKVEAMANNLLRKIRDENLNTSVSLINVKRYFKDYPDYKETLFGDISSTPAEIKSTNDFGIEFIIPPLENLYRQKNGKLTLKKKGEKVLSGVFKVGVVPYEWVEHIEPRGDDYQICPLIFCSFKKINWKHWWKLKLFKFPYRSIEYYKKNKDYKKGINKPWEEFSLIDEGDILER